MDAKTANLPTVSVFKDAKCWAYTDHRNHWKLVSDLDKESNTVVICHARTGEEVTINDPDTIVRHT